MRARYAEVVTVLARRVPDEQRRAPLREQAERLNPDNWATDDEVSAALEAYEAVLASFRDVLGRRRRRRGNRAGAGAGAVPDPAQADAPGFQDAHDGGLESDDEPGNE